MKARSEAVFRFAAPVRAAVSRFAFIALIATSFGLMLLGKAETVVVERVRMAISDVLAPVMGFLAQPAEALATASSELREAMDLFGENRRLREQIQRLERWQETARRLDTENQSLRQLLNYSAETATRSVTGRVIADSGGSFARSLLVSAGNEDGVTKGQIAMTGEGLVGRVSETGQHTSRVLLITDLNSRIPVIIESTRERAMLAGDNSSRPRLIYLPQDAHMSVGDRVVTSGHGGTLPPGLPIGIISAIGERGVLLQPHVDWSRLDYLRLMDYGVTNVLPPAPPPAPKAVRRGGTER